MRVQQLNSSACPQVEQEAQPLHPRPRTQPCSCLQSRALLLPHLCTAVRQLWGSVEWRTTSFCLPSSRSPEVHTAIERAPKLGSEPGRALRASSGTVLSPACSQALTAAARPAVVPAQLIPVHRPGNITPYGLFFFLHLIKFQVRTVGTGDVWLMLINAPRLPHQITGWFLFLWDYTYSSFCFPNRLCVAGKALVQ